MSKIGKNHPRDSPFAMRHALWLLWLLWLCWSPLSADETCEAVTELGAKGLHRLKMDQNLGYTWGFIPYNPGYKWDSCGAMSTNITRVN